MYIGCPQADNLFQKDSGHFEDERLADLGRESLEAAGEDGTIVLIITSLAFLDFVDLLTIRDNTLVD